jgi:hypothetical protein
VAPFFSFGMRLRIHIAMVFSLGAS